MAEVKSSSNPKSSPAAAPEVAIVKMKIPARARRGNGIAQQIHDRLVIAKGKFSKDEELRVWGGEKADTANKAAYIAAKLRSNEARHYDPVSRGNMVFVTITK